MQGAAAERAPADATPEAQDGSTENALEGEAAADDADDQSVPCQTQTECAFPNSYCEPTAGVCVACLSNTNCSTLEHRLCDPVGHRCVECLADGDCARELSTGCNLVTGDCIH